MENYLIIEAVCKWPIKKVFSLHYQDGIMLSFWKNTLAVAIKLPQTIHLYEVGGERGGGRGLSQTLRWVKGFLSLPALSGTTWSWHDQVWVSLVGTHFNVWRCPRSACGQTPGLIFGSATLIRTHPDLQGLHLLADVIGDGIGSALLKRCSRRPTSVITRIC